MLLFFFSAGILHNALGLRIRAERHRELDVENVTILIHWPEGEAIGSTFKLKVDYTTRSRSLCAHGMSPVPTFSAPVGCIAWIVRNCAGRKSTQVPNRKGRGPLALPFRIYSGQAKREKGGI